MERGIAVISQPCGNVAAVCNAVVWGVNASWLLVMGQSIPLRCGGSVSESVLSLW